MAQHVLKRQRVDTQMLKALFMWIIILPLPGCYSGFVWKLARKDGHYCQRPSSDGELFGHARKDRHDLHRVWVDLQGTTLYTFGKDTATM
jgi:hypothetical protein